MPTPTKIPASVCPPRFVGPIATVARQLRQLASERSLANQQQPFQSS